MKRDEFVFSLGGHKLYGIEDFDYFDDILAEEDRWFWNNVRRGYAMVFLQKVKKYEKEPEVVMIGKMPVDDAIKKFG
jgi:hypothetical protein